MFNNSFDQKNVMYASLGIGALCMAGGVWYYKDSLWNRTKTLFWKNPASEKKK